MATTHHLYADAYYIAHHIIKTHSREDDNERTRHFAALIIQRTWRGYVVKKMIRMWNRSATTIQRHVRGFLLRWHLPEIYREFLERRTRNHYNRMATKIQAAWRGFYVRKYIACVKDILGNRQHIKEENEKMMALLQAEFERMQREKDEENERNAKQWVLFMLFKIHHLIRTFHVEGIYSIHGKKKLSLLERLIKTVCYLPYMHDLKKEYKKVYEEYKRVKPFFFKTAKGKRMEELYRLRDKGPKEEFYIDKNIHEKPFTLTPKVTRPKYERGILASEKYVVYREPKVDRSKFVSKNDFVLYGMQHYIAEPRDIPYFLDLWEQFCVKHNIPGDVMCVDNILKT